MKTTLELPDELARRVKIWAVEHDQKLKDTIAELLELGLASASKKKASARLPRPVRLRKRGPLTIDDIEAAITGGRD